MAIQNLKLASERQSSLPPFTALPEDGMAPRDQRDLMERPFFSLAKSKRIAPIHYRAGDVEVHVFGLPEYGMATIWDADVLVWAASQIVEALDHGLAPSRFFRFTPYQLLTAIGRPTGLHQYKLLKAAFARLQSTVVRTTIRNGEHWRNHQFSWLNEWEEMADRSGRVRGMEFVLPDWFYRGVIDRSLVLTIDPAYFGLSGGIERWLYRIARKHAGRQPEGWSFDFRHLHAKSGSLARFSDFALDLRRITASRRLPGYRLMLRRAADGRELLHVAPELSTEAVENRVTPIGRSGATAIGTSGARLSADRAHGAQLSLFLETGIRARNDSNFESNDSYVVGAVEKGRRRLPPPRREETP